MSRTAEIATFIRLADGGLSTKALAAAIRRRWPQASADELSQAKAEAAEGLPADLDGRVAMDVGFAAMLGRRT